MSGTPQASVHDVWQKSQSSEKISSYLFLNLISPLPPYISESCIKIKINSHSYFNFSPWCFKRFYKSLLMRSYNFLKHQKRSENKNLSYFFCLRPGSGREGLRSGPLIVSNLLIKISLVLHISIDYCNDTLVSNFRLNTFKSNTVDE